MLNGNSNFRFIIHSSHLIVPNESEKKMFALMLPWQTILIQYTDGIQQIDDEIKLV